MRIHPFVAIDDFAFRKGSYYGTLFCDLKTGQPIDLLATRKQEEVTQWIKNHTAIIFMTRDGSTTYRKAIDSVERPIVQVMDRFHLLQNLYRYMVNALQRLLPQCWEKIEQKKEVSATLETDNSKQEIPQLNPKQQNKWQLIQRIQQDYQAGMSFRGLSRKYKIDRRTISKYIKMVNFPIQKRKSRPSMLNPYLETIHQMVKNHSTSRQIYEHIKRQGFKGGFDSVRVRVTSIRKEMPKTFLEPPNIKSYHRKDTMHLYWKLHQQLSDEERQDLNYALATFPNTQELYGFVQYFRENMNHYDSLSIQTLITSINNHTTPEIKSFIKYLYKELESIILSIHYTYSNGSIEGQINRLKTIKRTLYGRAGFELLKKRVLYRW